MQGNWTPQQMGRPQNQQYQQQFYRPGPQQMGAPQLPGSNWAHRTMGPMTGQGMAIPQQQVFQMIPNQQQIATQQQQQQFFQHQQQQQMIAQAHQSQMQKRQNVEQLQSAVITKPKKRKPNEKNIPSKVDTYVPESRLYTQLQEFERQLDATIMRRKLDMQENIAKASKVTRTLRIFVSNTAGSQYIPTNDNNEAVFDLDSTKTPNWTLKIEGRLLDVANKKYQTGVTHKFSYFIKSIIVELKRDNNLYSEGNVIAWQKNPQIPEMDGFEVKRRGDTELPCRIIITLDQPDKYKLAPELSKILDLHTDTRQNVIMALWQYIKYHKLQDPEDRKKVNPDEGLRNALGLVSDAPLPFTVVPDLVNSRLQAIDPIVINYTIKVDKEFSFSSTAYDVEVEFVDQGRKNIAAAIVHGNPVVEKDILALDEKITNLVSQISLCNLKRDFLLGFVRDPIGFLNTWVASQSRDLEVVLGDQRLTGEEVRRADFFKQQWVKDAISQYIFDRSQALR